MIQFNLLPDVKLEYIRARRSQRLVFGIAAIVTAVSVAILLVFLSVNIAEKKHLSDVNKDIASESGDLQKKPQIDKILTVQNQLQSLGKLHAGKPAATRLFDYFNEVTPVQASINDLKPDFVAHTIVVTGTADALSTVNTYIDTLKFTTYHTDKVKDSQKAFSNVVLSEFSLGSADASKTVPGQAPPVPKPTFTITLAYDPIIFDITQKVSLTVPAQVTTRSEIEKPTDLFTVPADTTTSGGGR